MKLSIILPCYNEGATLGSLVDAYREALKDLDAVELILVNNGSTDETAMRLKEEVSKGASFPIRIVTIPENIGYGHGILTGIQEAKGDYIAWSHSDLQCAPKDVVRLYREVMIRPNPKAIFGKGNRVNDRGSAAVFTKAQTVIANFILGCRMHEINAQPKLFHRDFLKEWKRPPLEYNLDMYAYFKAAKKNLDVVTIDVDFSKRPVGKSRWNYSVFSKVRFIITNFVYLVKLRFLSMAHRA